MTIVPMATVGVTKEFLEFVSARLSLRTGAPWANSLTVRAVREGTGGLEQ